MFTNCIIVKGASRSLIADIQRHSFKLIPDTMEEVVGLFIKKKSIPEVAEIYGEDSLDVIQEYIDFLIENDFGFITNAEEFDMFTDMDNTFEITSAISNCVIEVSNHSLLFIDKIVQDLENFNCRNIQIVSYEVIEIENLIKLLNSSKDTNFKSIELVLKFSDAVYNFLEQVDKYNFRVTAITLHSSPLKEIKKFSFDVTFLDYTIKDFRNCGIIDRSYFNVNKEKVFESLHHNSCLYKKISIDKNGDIRNCPAMPESFGNIKDTTLEAALNKPTFKKYWNINKDQISVCKDCEFRHICTDCRAYIEDPEDQYSKPLKCGYNPYTNVWEEWSKNPLKEKAITYYEMGNLVRNKTKL